MKESQPVSLDLITPGDAVKDSLLGGAGLSLALFFKHVEIGLLLGVVNLLLVAFFRGLELYLKYRRKGRDEK